MDVLPDELLLSIINFLPIAQISQVMWINKRFRSLCNSHYFWLNRLKKDYYNQYKDIVKNKALSSNPKKYYFRNYYNQDLTFNELIYKIYINKEIIIKIGEELGYYDIRILGTYDTNLSFLLFSEDDDEFKGTTKFFLYQILLEELLNYKVDIRHSRFIQEKYWDYYFDNSVDINEPLDILMHCLSFPYNTYKTKMDNASVRDMDVFNSMIDRISYIKRYLLTLPEIINLTYINNYLSFMNRHKEDYSDEYD